jgi:uncharacterized membrane protein YeaQ/YmgE (transglycosylase-associated protein family)
VRRGQQLILGLFGALFASALVGVAVHPSLETGFAACFVAAQLGALLWIGRRARP